MGQEFHVVRCFSCLAFQSHQVRKDRKFVCKLCGEKQSVKKDYGRGTGKDCRIHVQKLNRLRGSLAREEEERVSPQNDDYEIPVSRWKTSDQSDGIFTHSECHDASKEESEDNVAGTAITLCNPKSKWASYIASEADNSDEDNATDTSSDTSFGCSQIKYEGFGTGVRHASTQIRSEKGYQKTSQGPVRDHAKRTKLSKWDELQFNPYVGSSVNMRRIDVEMLTNKPGLIDGESEGLRILDNHSLKPVAEQRQTKNHDNSFTSRDIFKTSDTSNLEGKNQFGDKTHVTLCKGIHMNSCKSSEMYTKTRTTFLSKFDKSLEKNFAPKMSVSLTGCTVKKTSSDTLNGKANAADSKQPVHPTLSAQERHPVHKSSHLIFEDNNVQKEIFKSVDNLLHAKGKSYTPVNIKKSAPINNPLTGGLITGEHFSSISQSSHGSSSVISQSGLSNKYSHSNSKIRLFSNVELYSKYEAAEDLENMTNCDL
ncbi:hypothetical protein OTU49_017378 [Cherax quadricarinatus]|uniref:MRN complex-interacting protein N-terminal domain-containing protein n=2 Tax=Cherax quadricarinatus TaxID=27406 RepID=A0AAW0Y3C9_CHEQU